MALQSDNFYDNETLSREKQFLQRALLGDVNFEESIIFNEQEMLISKKILYSIGDFNIGGGDIIRIFIKTSPSDVEVM